MKLEEWMEECQLAFNKLKELCTSTPILAYADYKKEFQLKLMLVNWDQGECFIRQMMKEYWEL